MIKLTGTTGKLACVVGVCLLGLSGCSARLLDPDERRLFVRACGGSPVMGSIQVKRLSFFLTDEEWVNCIKARDKAVVEAATLNGNTQSDEPTWKVVK